MGNNQSGEGEDDPVEVKKKPSKKKPPQQANGAQRPPPTATPTQAAQGPPQQLPPGQSMPLHETFIAPGTVPNTMPAMPPPEYCPRPPATMMATAPTMIASPMQKLPDAIRSPPTSVYLPMPQQAARAGVPASPSVRSFTEAPLVAPPVPAAVPPPDAGAFDIFGTPNLFGPGPRGAAPKVAPFAAPWAGKPVMPPNLMMTGQMPLMVPPPGVPQQQRSYVPPPQPQQQVPVMVPQQQRSYVPPPQMQQQVPSYVAPPPMAAPVQMPSYVAPPQMFSPLNSQVVVPPQSRSYVPPVAVSAAAAGASGSYVPPAAVSVAAAMGASGSFVPPPQFAVPQPMPVQAQVAYAQPPPVVETFFPSQPGVAYVETVGPVVEFEIASQPAVTYASPAPIIETAIAPQPAVAYAQTAVERAVPSQAAFTYSSQAPAVETVMTARQPAGTVMTARPPPAQVLSSPFTKGARVEYLARSNGVWYPGVIDGTDPAGYTVKLDVGESKIVPAFEAPSRLRLA